MRKSNHWKRICFIIPLFADGASPSVLLQATDGSFYGTAMAGGANSFGTIFKITSAGTLTTLHDFNFYDGCNPVGGSVLVQGTDGNFYGTTTGGGANGDGMVFSLSVGRGPFVKTQTSSGKVGAPVNILGTNLTGAASVRFNGTAAAFRVVLPSLIAAAVPAGATTGRVQVTTPAETLFGNVAFLVTP